MLNSQSLFKIHSLKKGVTFQPVPTYANSVNATEHTIQTFKKHILSDISISDLKIPITEWERLLQQFKITQIILRTSRYNTKLFVHTLILNACMTTLRFHWLYH